MRLEYFLYPSVLVALLSLAIVPRLWLSIPIDNRNKLRVMIANSRLWRSEESAEELLPLTGNSLQPQNSQRRIHMVSNYDDSDKPDHVDWGSWYEMDDGAREFHIDLEDDETDEW